MAQFELMCLDSEKGCGPQVLPGKVGAKPKAGCTPAGHRRRRSAFRIHSLHHSDPPTMATCFSGSKCIQETQLRDPFWLVCASVLAESLQRRLGCGVILSIHRAPPAVNGSEAAANS